MLRWGFKLFKLRSADGFKSTSVQHGNDSAMLRVYTIGELELRRNDTSSLSESARLSAAREREEGKARRSERRQALRDTMMIHLRCRPYR